MSDPAALADRLWGCWGMARLSLPGGWGGITEKKEALKGGYHFTDREGQRTFQT